MIVCFYIFVYPLHLVRTDQNVHDARQHAERPLINPKRIDDVLMLIHHALLVLPVVREFRQFLYNIYVFYERKAWKGKEHTHKTK